MNSQISTEVTPEEVVEVTPEVESVEVVSIESNLDVIKEVDDEIETEITMTPNYDRLSKIENDINNLTTDFKNVMEKLAKMNHRLTGILKQIK